LLPLLCMRAISRPGAAVLVALVVAACAALQLQAPKLSVVSVQLMGSDLWEQHLRVRMHVQNPNDRELPIKGLEYTLEVDGQTFATGHSAASFVIPPSGEAEFDMNVTTNLASTLLKLLSQGSQGLGRGIPYRMTGKVSLASGVMRSIPFDERGTFKLQ